MNNEIKKYIIIGITIVIAVAVYVYGINLKETNKMRFEQNKIQAQEQNYQDCKDSAYEVYSSGWDSKCKIEGLEEDCVLDGYQREAVETDYEKAKDRCVDMYK